MNTRKGSFLLQGAFAFLFTGILFMGLASFFFSRVSERQIDKAQVIVWEKINGKSLEEIKKMDCQEDFEIKVESDRNVYVTAYLGKKHPITFRAYEEDGQVKLTHTNLNYNASRQYRDSGITIFTPFPVRIP